jgi:hypothetical protein
VRSIEDRQLGVGGLRIITFIGDDAQQVHLADAGHVTRSADGVVEELAEEGDAQRQAKAEHDAGGHGEGQLGELGHFGDFRLGTPVNARQARRVDGGGHVTQLVFHFVLDLAQASFFILIDHEQSHFT